MGLREAEIRRELDACLCTHYELLPRSPPLEDPFVVWPPISDFLHDDEEEVASGEGASREDIEGAGPGPVSMNPESITKMGQCSNAASLMPNSKVRRYVYVLAYMSLVLNRLCGQGPLWYDDIVCEPSLNT
jgi:hypothetical protein